MRNLPGIESRAKEWAARARKGWENIAGKESWEAKRTGELERDVKNHPTFATWDKDPWDDSAWENDEHHDHEHEHDRGQDRKGGENVKSYRGH